MTSATPEQAASPQDQPSPLKLLVVVLLALAFFASPLFMPSSEPVTGDQAKVWGSEIAGDGLQLLQDHPVLRGIAAGEEGLGATLTTSWWEGRHEGQALWRPVPMFLMGIASGVSGKPYDMADPGSDGLPFRFLGLGLHVLAAVLVFLVAHRLTGSENVALVAGALFATIPVHTEVLLDVAGLAELSAAVFGLGSWLLWLSAGDQPLKNPGPLAGSLACLALAGLSKESAFALPLVFFLVDAGRSGKGLDFGGALKKLPALGAMVAVLALLLVLRVTVLGSLLPEYTIANHLDNPLLGAGPLDRIANGFRMLASGLVVMLGINPLRGEGLSLGFSADYSAGQVEALGAFAIWNLVAIVAVLGSIAAAFVLSKRCSMRAGLWLALLASMLLTSNILMPIGTVFAERLLYFPSAVLVLFLAMTLVRLGKAGLAAGILVAVGAGFWTMDRAAAWSDPIELLRVTEREDAPRSAKAKFFAGLDLRQQDLLGFAIDKLGQAVEIFPDYVVAHSNLGVTYELDLQNEEALPHYLRSMEIQLEASGHAYVPEPFGTPLGQADLLYLLTELRSGQLDDAQGHLDWLDGIIQKGYDSPHAHTYRGVTLLRLGRVPEGEEAYRRSIELEPTVSGVASLGRLLRQTGRHDEARELYTRYSGHDGWEAAAQAELLLRQADAELAFDPQAALATTDRLVELLGQDSVSEEQIFRLKWTVAQAHLELLPADPAGRLDTLKKIEGELKSAFAVYGEANDMTHSARYALVRVFELTGNDAELIATAEELLSYDTMPALRATLAAAYGRTGAGDKALENWRAAADGLVAEDGTPVDAEVLLGARRGLLMALEAAGRGDEVAGLFESWHLLAGGTDPWTLSLEADHLAGTGDLGAALSLAEKLVADHPEIEQAEALLGQLQTWAAGTDITASAGLAQHMISWNRFDVALPVTERALAQAPDDLTRAQALGLMANCLVYLDRRDDALARLDEALALTLPQGFKDQIQRTRDQIAAN